MWGKNRNGGFFMSNGSHTLDLVKAENARIIATMKSNMSSGGCGDASVCASGFERVLSLIELLFEITYEKVPSPDQAQPPAPKVYVPKNIKEAMLFATTQSPGAVAAVIIAFVAYCIYFGKTFPGF